AVQNLPDLMPVVVHEPDHACIRRGIDHVLRDDARLSGAVDQYIEVAQYRALVEGEEVFNQQTVIEQKEERCEEADVDNRCRHKKMPIAEMKKEVESVDTDQV